MFTFSRRRRFLTGRFWPLCPLSICLSRCYRAHNIRPEVHDKLFQCEAITWLRLFMQPFVLINVFIFKLKTLPLITAFIFKKLPVSARSQIPTVIAIWIFDFFFIYLYLYSPMFWFDRPNTSSFNAIESVDALQRQKGFQWYKNNPLHIWIKWAIKVKVLSLDKMFRISWLTLNPNHIKWRQYK